MRRRIPLLSWMMLALGAGVAGVAGSSACTSFDEAPASPSPVEGGNESSIDGDGGGSGDAQASRFCATQTDALFCDDFDQPERRLASESPAPWDVYSAKGSAPLTSLGTGVGGSRALQIKGNVNATSDVLLRRTVDLRNGKNTRVRFKMQLDMLGGSGTDGGVPFAIVASFRFQDGQFVRWSIAPEGPTDITGFVQTFISPGTTLYYDELAIPPQRGRWLDLAIEVEPSGNEARFLVKVGGQQLKELPKLILPQGGVAFALGAEAYGEGSNLDVDVRFDDVVIESY